MSLHESQIGSLPVGTVTFMLTDIEGSTRLWESDREAMADAVPRHYELLANAIACHRGAQPQEQGEGDSVVAAFAHASDGLAAALDAQRALNSEQWPTATPLRVRIAVHTGEAQLRDEGNYFGPALNRCARLRTIAYGGQILVSRAVHDLVADRLPDSAELVDLGVHRLRDLGRPEQVFGVEHPDLPAEFEPLRSLDAFATNLPDRLTSFVGRERELAEVADALAADRVFTLTGAGGCGKTRLALQVAADSLDRYPDGAWWVELAPLQDDSLVAEALCEALAVTPLPGVMPLAAASAHLAERRALVILDNCEHLLAAVAEAVDELARACPQLTLLMTSRAPLGVEGEHAWRVPSLALPGRHEPETVEVLSQADAVRLFLDRARQVRPNFAITNENAPAVAQICHDLDGIPLAIELAAARVRVLAVEQIAAGLTDRFRLLTGSTRGALPRQQTLRASVDWSHDLLSADEQVLLRRLGVFVGGFTLEACEQVCGDDSLPQLAILDLLTSLVDRSLVQADEAGEAVRYHCLETVRQYAAEHLAEAGEVEALRNRHLDAMLALAEELAPHLVSVDQDRWLDRLDADYPNLAAAIEHAINADSDKGLRLCIALTVLWKLRGRFAEADAAYARALALAGEQPSPLRARVLWARSYLGAYGGDFDAAVTHAQEGLEMARALGEASTAARCLDVLATLQSFPDPAGAVETAEAAIALGGEAGDDWCVADASQIAAYGWLFQDRAEELEEKLRSVDELIVRMGYREFVAWQQVGMSYGFYQRGELGRMREGMKRAAIAAREVGEPTSEAAAEVFLSLADIEQGNAAEALERVSRTLEKVVRAGAGMILPAAEEARAWALAALGRHEEAEALLREMLAGPTVDFAWLAHTVEWLLARVLIARGEPEEARRYGEAVLAAVRQTPNAFQEARANVALARAANAQGRWADADRHAHAGLDLLVEHELGLEYATALDALAEVAAGLESYEEATRLLGAAARARAERGLARWRADEEQFTALADRLRAECGESAYAECFAEAQELTTDEAIAWARRARGSRRRPSGGWESLTPTELTVAGLVVEGMTNPQIGERMFISRGTVKVHLSNILRKLDMSTRAEVAAEAARRATEARADS